MFNHSDCTHCLHPQSINLSKAKLSVPKPNGSMKVGMEIKTEAMERLNLSHNLATSGARRLAQRNSGHFVFLVKKITNNKRKNLENSNYPLGLD